MTPLNFPGMFFLPVLFIRRGCPPPKTTAHILEQAGQSSDRGKRNVANFVSQGGAQPVHEWRLLGGAGPKKRVVRASDRPIGCRSQSGQCSLQRSSNRT